jgi:hypothetical protein
MRLELFFKRKHAGRQLFNSNLMIEFTSSAGGCERAAFRLFLSQQLQKHLPLGIIFGVQRVAF